MNILLRYRIALLVVAFGLMLNACQKDETVVLSKVRTSAASDVSETSAKFLVKIEVVGSAPVQEMGVVWSKSPAPTIEDTKVVAAAGKEELPLDIAGLKSGTLYFVRSYLIDRYGVVYGDERSFTTEGQLAYVLPFVERFRGADFPPLFWKLLDGDGDGNGWEFYSSRFVGALSASYGDAALTPENYLVSPKITISGSNPKIHFSVGVTSVNYYAEHYKLVVSETPFTMANRATNGKIIFEETMTKDAARMLVYRDVDVKAYAGKDVYFAWVHYNCTDNDAIYITDIRVYSDEAPASIFAPSVALDPIGDIGKTSAALRATVTREGDASITRKGFCYATSENPTVTSTVVDIQVNKDFAALIINLQPGTKYYVRAFAQNEKGIAYSDQKTFVTPAVVVTDLFTETFQTSLPSTWANIDKDGDGNTWYYSTNRKAVFSESYYEKALTPENYLVSPSIVLPSDAESVELTFEVAARSANYFAETYKVVISTEAITVDNCRSAATLVGYTTLTNAYAGANYIAQKVDISMYKGKAVYIGFLHGNSTDQDAILLRNVVVKSYK